MFLLLISHFLFPTSAAAADWSGVDESVVEKYAKDHGREAKGPLINTDQGDLLLFMFLIGGVIGGFAAGYYWRTLTEDRTKNKEQRTKTEKGCYHA
ncbi:MAG: cobalt ABC transporter permease [Nitrospirae bacterium]|nr:cobalt ABC transporter permease [Nitrospirota bacterium]